MLRAAAAAINACRFNGAKIGLSAANYSRAEAASRLGGGAGVLSPPPDPATMTAPGPPGTLGPGEPPPALWAVVRSLVQDLWPDADVAALHAAAGRWRSFGAAIGGIQGVLNASDSLVGGLQIPEGAQIGQVLSQIGENANSVGAHCGKLAATLDGFADQVSRAQHAIRDLLHRLGPLANPAHDAVLIFEGKAFDEIEKIAEDINAVLHNLGREARAFEQSLNMGMQIIDGVVVGMEKFIRGRFTHFLGQEVGNQVATVFDTWVNTGEGVFKGAFQMAQGIEELDPRWFLIDPDGAAATWTAMTGTGLLNHILNPQRALEADKQMFGSVLHLDDWRADRPGLGLGENVFDVGMLFLPGAGEAGAAAKGAAAAGRAAAEGGEAADAAGAAGRGAQAAGGVGALGDIAKAGSGLTGDLDGLTGDLPKNEAQVAAQPVTLPTDKLPAAPVEPAPHPADGAHEPASAPAGGGWEPASGPASAEARAHEPAGGPRESGSAPTEGPRGPAPAGSAHERGWVPTTSSRGFPSATPQLVEHAPTRAPVSPSTSPAASAPAPAAAHSPQAAPAAASPVHRAPAANSASPGGYRFEPPAPHGNGPHGPGDGHSGGGPFGHDDGGLSDGRPHRPRSCDEKLDGRPSGRQDDAPGGDTGNETPEETGDAPPAPTNVPGIDYPLPADDALHVLERPGAELERLADGGVPPHILEGYDPLAGRTVEEFKNEFTIHGPNNEIRWDWHNQAPMNGFADEPLASILHRIDG